MRDAEGFVCVGGDDLIERRDSYRCGRSGEGYNGAVFASLAADACKFTRNYKTIFSVFHRPKRAYRVDCTLVRNARCRKVIRESARSTHYLAVVKVQLLRHVIHVIFFGARLDNIVTVRLGRKCYRFKARIADNTAILRDREISERIYGGVFDKRSGLKERPDINNSGR